MMSSKKIFSGVIWSVLVNIVNALYGFLAVPLLIDKFGRSDYGLIALAVSVNGYMALLDMGLGSTNVRFFSEWISTDNKDKLKKLFSTSNAFYGLVGILNAIVLLVVYCFADSLFNLDPGQLPIIRNLLLILMASAMVNWYTSCFSQLIQASENVAWVQKTLLATKLLTVVALLLTIIFDLTIPQYYFLTILAVWVTLPFVIRKIKTITPYISFKPLFDYETFKEILPYSLNIFSFSIFSVIYQSSRTFFLGVEASSGDVTDFSVLNGIIGIVQAVTGVFCGAILPSSSKAISNNDRIAYYKIAYQGTKYVTIFVTFCVFGMCTIAKQLLYVYVGDSFMQLLPLLYIYILTLLSNHILANSSLILGGRNILPLSKMTAVSASIAILVMWVFIPYFKVGGVIIGVVCYNILQQLYYYSYYWPKLLFIDSKKILVKSTIPIMGIGAITCLISVMLPIIQNPWISMIERGLTFSIFYGFMIYIYINRDDRIFLIGLIKK